MGGAATVLSDNREVRCAIPQLGAEEHQHLPGQQGHIRATILQPETPEEMWEQRGGGAAQSVLKLW